jgi:membrane fusion protein, copper/silver efflux system
VKTSLKHPIDMRVLIVAFILPIVLGCKENNQLGAPSMKTQAMSAELMLNESQIRLADITTQVVKNQSFSQTLPVNARLVANEELTEVISSRASGRIEKLYVKEDGRMVNTGEPLYELYSESLLTLQREYVMALEQLQAMKGLNARYEDYLKSARKKLLLYGLTDQQIDLLNDSGDIQPRITFLATASGVVKEIKVSEGQYLNEGDALYQLENIQQLWVEAELYPSELQYVKVAVHKPIAFDFSCIRMVNYEEYRI